VDVALRVFYPEIPVAAERAPSRSVYVGDHAGRCEVHTWDGTRARRVTDRPQGTVTAAIDPAGERVWWFDDDLAGVGTWRVQPFGGGPDAPALPGVPAGRAAGLATALDGTVAVAIATDTGSTVHLAAPGGPARELLRTPAYRYLVDLAPDGGLVAVGGEPDGPDAVTVLDPTGRVLAGLDGTTGQLWGMGFAPAGPPVLLLVAEHPEGYRLATWTAAAGLVPAPGEPFDSEVAASWYPDGRRVLVRQDRRGRSELLEVDAATGTARRLPTAPGSILAAGVQPDGDLQYVWTSGNHPPRLRSAAGLRLPGADLAVLPGRRAELSAPGPGGTVHALVAAPAGPGPYPTVFLLHGGPHEAARDEYDPLVSLFVSTGCAVIRPNYRGSTGYGPAWRAAVSADGVGLTQLADLAAVRAEAVRTGLTRPELTAVAGESWGGYLALLAAGVQPQLWRAVAALTPIADYAGAFRAGTPAVRALDVRLFGGDPDQVPDRYAAASPLTYADRVAAPVLVVAGTDDPRCPPGQVLEYAAALRRHGARPDLRWTRSGHEELRAAERAETLGAVVTFVCTALGGHALPDPAGTR
jgi:acylaminoacyl-peptidase